MDQKKHHIRRVFPDFVCICCFCALVFTLSSCTPLRRKFTRKKKKDGEESQKFIPVLEPVDYPQKIYSSLEKYKHHYSLWKVWDRDLLQTIESDGSDKRQKYLLGQALEQLEGMKKLLVDEKKSEFPPLIDKLREVEQVYKKPVSMRNKFSIKKKIERNSREIRNGFAPDPALLAEE
ncbi:MAG: hypothetical protein KAS66_01030 [Candidatus Omnitrophica bacterium]|nr:hypothetical protein [Candidatus Omnitrophota bacterium]MCK5259946.1 hypothetical protein [Candidatus Omnitrophota bacterium]